MTTDPTPREAADLVENVLVGNHAHASPDEWGIALRVLRDHARATTALPTTTHEADEEVWRVHDQLRAEAGIQRGRGGEEQHVLAVRLDKLADRLTAARWRPVAPAADGGNVVDAIAALASTVARSPSTTAALILRYPGLAHGIDRVTRFADPPVDVYSFRPAHPCRRCGHDRADHHKLHCEADNGDCECPGGWVPVDGPSASGDPANGGGS